MLKSKVCRRVGGMRVAARVSAAALIFGLHVAAIAHPGAMQSARTVPVEVRDLDLASQKGRLALYYRVAAQASAQCETAEPQSGSQYRACVQLAAEEARDSCRSAGSKCEVTIAPHAQIPLRTRPSFGPRSM